MSITFENLCTGIFKNEIKNRFRCIVKVDEKDELCYIQSSSRLDNYVLLKNKSVILRKIENPNKMNYAVLAKPYHKDYILLAPMMANEIIFSEINRRLFSKLGYRKNAILEFTVDGYKADIYLPKSDRIIEIKALISDKKDGNVFPTVYSDRTLKQLTAINKLLILGKKCNLIIVSFNPYFKNIVINTNTMFYNCLKECLDNGLELDAYSISCQNNIHIKKKIDILFR